MEQDWLLVFDNADCDPSLVAKYMPIGNHGNILFTSRNAHMGGRNISPATSVSVDDMVEEDAISLLLKAVWLEVSSPEMKQAAKPIVKELCCLPLVIDQAGAAIKTGLCTIENYLEMYSEHRQRLMGHALYQCASNHDHAVYATWDLSFVAIEAMTTGLDSIAANAAKSAIVILQTFAFFHHENIREDIIKRSAEALKETGHGNSVHPNLHASDVLQLLQLGRNGKWDPLFFREGIQVLLSFALIRQSVTSNVYSMHGLVHSWSQDRMSQEEKQSRCLSSGTLLSLSITFPFLNEGYAFRRALVPHIKVNQFDPQVKVIRPYDEKQYIKFAFVLDDNGLWKEAEKLLVQVMEMRTRVFGVEDPCTLSSMGNLAGTYVKQGQWKDAEKLLVQIMEISIRMFGTEHPSTARHLSDLAAVCCDQGQWKKAEKLNLQAMEISTRICGVEHPDTLIRMGNLAVTYSKQGQWNDAEKLQAQVMEISKRVHGVEHPSTLITMSNLALTYNEQGKWKEAEKLQVQVMEIRMGMLGVEDPSTLTTMGNLASTYLKQGKWKEAKKLEAQVMEISMRVFGVEHPSTLL
jgi:tetratricopeptide (TPR) repeat protein